jgi:hypothetical protein
MGAGLKARSPAQPSPFEPGQARSRPGPEVGFGWASDMGKPEARAYSNFQNDRPLANVYSFKV